MSPRNFHEFMQWQNAGVEADHVTVRYADGTTERRPVKQTPEGFARTELDGLKRELAGVRYRLALLDEPPALLPFQDPPSSEQVQRTRTELDNVVTVIQKRIVELEQELGEATPVKKRGQLKR